MAMVQITRWKKLTSWSPPGSRILNSDWPMMSISDILREIPAVAHDPKDDKIVRFAGVRWYGNGIFIREERTPEQVGGKCYPVIPGALIYNRLFGWKSAFALVPEAFNGVMVSNEFPQFTIDEKLVDPQFLTLVLGSEIFASVMLGRSTGTTAVSRNRLHVEDLLALEMPIPPLELQQSLVAEAGKLIHSAADLERGSKERREQALLAFEEALGAVRTQSVASASMVSIGQFARLSRWDTEASENDLALKYPLEQLNAHAEIRLGCQVPKKGANGSGVERPYLRAANVQRGWFALSNVKTMRVAGATAEALRLRHGDLLFVEGNSQEEVGRSAVWDLDDSTIFQNSVVRARTNPDTLNPRFASTWFNSVPGRRYFQDNATTTTGTLWHIGAGKTGRALVPVPPLEVQTQLAEAYNCEIELSEKEENQAKALRLEALQFFATAVFGVTDAVTEVQLGGEEN